MQRVPRLLPLTAALLAASLFLTLRPARSAAPSASAAAADGVWRVVAWNDLGMHCMDGDYSVFSILPPFNVVQAQVVKPGGELATAADGIQLTYHAVMDPEGSFNSTSQGKTNYWEHAPALFGASGTPDTGLAGYDMPGPANTPQAMGWDGARELWFAEGIPITPLDSQQRMRNYPLMRVVARSAGGTWLAASDVVLPVSSEMDCRACHASGSGPAAEPAGGWAFDESAERDSRRNILRLHDEDQLGNPLFDGALATLGFDSAGLLATADGGRAILCASCHRSNALPGTGLPGIPQLTTALHASHAVVTDPETGMTLDDSDLRTSCYLCHPGSETRCLRGAMGSAVAPNGDLAMQCQSCHGVMSDVGDSAREGWLEQPNCQACHTGTATHNNGQIRYLSALEPDGSLRVAVNDTFATDANVPGPGFSLYRFSDGHGGLTCEACHGSTHAEYPGLHGNDNLQVQALQGHSGTLAECTTCHAQQPETNTGGPHGMHPLGDFWVDHHTDAAEQNPTACRDCHGTNYQGTELSRMQADRVLHTKWGAKSWFRGATVSCYGCHNGPSDDHQVNNAPAVAQSTSAVVGDQPVPIALVANDPNGNPLTLRIVSQPSGGRVGLAGTTATYYPDPGFAGADVFTFAAWDGKVESNLATVTVTRLASWSNAGTGYPGTAGAVPSLTASAGPKLGSQVVLQVGNSAGVDTLSMLVVSTEYASLDSGFGATLWVLPQTLVGLNVPAAGLDLPYSVPSAPGLIGVQLRLQAVLFDPGAPYWLAFTPALVLVHGP